MARVMIALWENKSITVCLPHIARVMIAQQENKCISLSVLPVARLLLPLGQPDDQHCHGSKQDLVYVCIVYVAQGDVRAHIAPSWDILFSCIVKLPSCLPDSLKMGVQIEAHRSQHGYKSIFRLMRSNK